jgi:DNA-binding transcriptional LysR family regulator
MARYSRDQVLGSENCPLSLVFGNFPPGPESRQTLVDRASTEGGYRRNIWLQLPYFIPAIAALQDTDYVLTCPSRLAQQMLSRYALHEVKAPPEIPAFSYFMFWHPRLTDENLHSWFREFVLDSCTREFGDRKR